MSTIRKNGEAVYCVGASRSGKTTYAQHKILTSKYPRLLIWDFQGQWQGMLNKQGLKVETITGRAQLINALRGDASKERIICYTPPTFSTNLSAEFDVFCGAALLWIKERQAAIVCEELASVTKGGAARGNWQMLQLQGQKYGGVVIAIIQRAQEGDKTTLTQATEVVLFRQHDKDVDYIQSALGVKREEIPSEDLFFCLIDKKGGRKLGKIELHSDNPRLHNIQMVKQ